VFGANDFDVLTAKLAAAEIAFARVSDMAALAVHPHLHRITIETPSGPVSYPAPPHRHAGAYGAVPALGQHTERARKEFAAVAAAKAARTE
jgi:formyl-CoA transferase